VIDLLFIATAPDSFSKPQVQQIFDEALEEIGEKPEGVFVEEIESIIEYETYRLLAENPQLLGSTAIGSTIVYKLKSNEGSQWVVPSKDAALPVESIEFEYKDPTGELKTDTVDAGAQDSDSRFRLKSKVSGTYLFDADPSWSLVRYHLKYDGSEDEWRAWPRPSRRWRIRLPGFPSDEARYAALKGSIENPEKPNAPKITGEQFGVFSIANVGRPPREVTSGGWTAQGAFTFSVVNADADEAWILFPLNKEQMAAAVKVAKARQSDEWTDASLPRLLREGNALAGHAIQTAPVLDGEVGATWSALKRTPDGFGATFESKNAAEWRKLFPQPPGATAPRAYALVVLIKEGRALRFGQAGDLWFVVESTDWNGGRRR